MGVTPHRAFIWTDEVSDWAGQDVEPWHSKPADVLTWCCLCGGFAIATVIVAVALNVWR